MWSVGAVVSDKYRLVRSLGAGGMGEVFLAEHTFLEKPVAIKVLHPFVAQDEAAVKRFYREAQAAAAMRHPGITDVYDVGWEADGTPYIVMEYLEGDNLERVMAKEGGGLDPEYAAEIAAEVLGILSVVHDRGIVHRDLKPENVFLCSLGSIETLAERRVKILDFGVSKVISATSSSGLTRMGDLLGSIPYMSPEQARGETHVDHRADIWGVGAVLYRALTGHPPFPAKRVQQGLLRIIEDPLKPPREELPELSTELDAIVCRALAKEADGRYQAAVQFRSDLLAYLDGVQRERRAALTRRRTREDETKVDVPQARSLPSPAPSSPPPAHPSGAPLADSEPRVHCIRVVRGLDAGSVVHVTGRGITIGRGEGCDLRLADEGVSRRHARVYEKGQDLLIEDLGSTNGVRVNGSPAIQAKLLVGDRIALGNHTLLKYVRLRTEEVSHHRQLYESIALDVLTGALNRRSIETRLAAEWSYALRQGLDVSVVLLDVDGFGAINQGAGDGAGDQVLRDLSRVIRAELRGEDLFGRYGGDEFLIVALGVDAKGALRFAKRLRKQIGKHSFVANGLAVRVSFSMGVATMKASRERWPTDLLELVHERLALAKRAGGGRDVGG